MRIWVFKLLVSVALSLAVALFVRSDVFDTYVVAPLMGETAAKRDPQGNLVRAWVELSASASDTVPDGATLTDAAAPADSAAPQPGPVTSAGPSAARGVAVDRAGPARPGKGSVRVNRPGGGEGGPRFIRVSDGG